MDREKALDLAKQTLLQEVVTLQALAESMDDKFWQVASLLSTCSGMIWITAVGTSAAVAMRFAHILTCCGSRSMFLSPSDGLHGHTGVIQPVDILIAMSRGGETKEVIQMVRIANDRNASTIAFVNNTDSSLSHACKHILPIQSPHRYELMGYIATTSTVAYSAVCDALCAVVLEAKGYTPDKFAKTHPGGAVGQVLSSSKNNMEHQE
ncbi:MAG TPA: SIS domain-containing protein [Anaerolineales bacterium]|jgi:D-arabinose 5-phosphate isomerase GutQ|nr:SIS domain-containing protein [Anaerolineales bacterium]